MGYPMTYPRVIGRNGLGGNYRSADGGVPDAQSLIAGDLRRLEHDTRDAAHLQSYARLAAVTARDVEVLFNGFFSGQWDDPGWGHIEDPYAALKHTVETLRARIVELEGTIHVLHTATRMAMKGLHPRETDLHTLIHRMEQYQSTPTIGLEAGCMDATT